MARKSLFSERINELSKTVPQTSPETLRTLLKDPEENVTIIDVRETYEWNEEHIPSSVYMGRGCLERDIVSLFQKI